MLKRWDITLALVPPDSRLADELVRDQQWRPWFCDSVAVVLQRPSEGLRNAAGSIPASGPCGRLTAALR